jgi:hypothetical protein
LRAFIEWHFEEGQPATFVGIANELFDCFAIRMISDTLRKIVKGLGWCKIIIGKVMEENRAVCPREDIDEHFRSLAALIDEVFPEFVCNVDESGFQQWIDARNQLIIIPTEYEGDEIPLQVEGQGKRSPLLVSISAVGDCLKSVIIIGRK